MIQNQPQLSFENFDDRSMRFLFDEKVTKFDVLSTIIFESIATSEGALLRLTLEYASGLLGIRTEATLWLPFHLL